MTSTRTIQSGVSLGGSRYAAIVFAAAVAAGILWITHYLLQLSFGLATGKVLFEQQGIALWRCDAVAFFGAYIGTGLALIGLSARLKKYSRVASVVGAILALIAVVAGMVGAVTGLVGPEIADRVFSIAGKSILSLFLSSLVLGITGLRHPVKLPRQVSLAVLLFGLLTMPLAMALGMLEQVVPPYFVTELHFTLSGTAWLAVATTMRRIH